MKFQRASDDVLRKNGWDPAAIVAHDDGEEGPFAVARINNATCGHCGQGTEGWTVVNLATATGISTDWTHREAETEAHEKASELNYAWCAGHASELLQAEVHNILSFDLDRLTGSVIDAYTLAPNDEEAKREAVRAAIERGIKR